MRCPSCLNETRVTDTRARNDNTVRRTRLCTGCGQRIQTTETCDYVPPYEIERAVKSLQQALTALTAGDKPPT